MSPFKSEQVTDLLNKANSDPRSRERLWEIVHEDLLTLARFYFGREADAATLQPTALVNELYLRLGLSEVAWKGRRHFFVIAARQMRRILVDHARAQSSQKRDGGVQVTLQNLESDDESLSGSMLDVHNALKELAEFDPRKSDLLELHYFAGLGFAEAARVLEVSVGTVTRDMRLAKAWMRSRLGAGSAI